MIQVIIVARDFEFSTWNFAETKFSISDTIQFRATHTYDSYNAENCSFSEVQHFCPCELVHLH